MHPFRPPIQKMRPTALQSKSGLEFERSPLKLLSTATSRNPQSRISSTAKFHLAERARQFTTRGHTPLTLLNHIWLDITTMFIYAILTFLLAMLSNVRPTSAALYTTSPTLNTVWTAGENVSISWTDDGQFPEVLNLGPFDIELHDRNGVRSINRSLVLKPNKYYRNTWGPWQGECSHTCGRTKSFFQQTPSTYKPPSTHNHHPTNSL